MIKELSSYSKLKEIIFQDCNFKYRSGYFFEEIRDMPLDRVAFYGCKNFCLTMFEVLSKVKAKQIILPTDPMY